jgi:two-component system, sporulation sensor kinase C
LAATVIGIATADPIHTRVLDAAVTHIGFQPLVLDPSASFTSMEETKAELILAETEVATRLMEELQRTRQPDDPYRPAIIAIIPKVDGINQSGAPTPYDGVLVLPQLPGEIAAQLSVAVYAHRAFAHRFEGAMDELKLHRQVFHSVTSGISATERELPLTYVNPSFEVLTGYSLEESIGKNCRFLQGNERDQPGLVLVREAIAEQRETKVVLRNFRKDGTPFWNELSLSPIRDRQGKVTHFVGIQTDVTARVEFETALRESEKLAVAGRLASSIAHEINNPLESVTNLVYLAEHSDSLDECRHFLKQVDEELRRVKLITSQSLRFTRQSTHPQAVLLQELVDVVLDLSKARIQAAHVTVERRALSHRHIVCMESEIRQVIHNLVRNAVDAMKNQGGGRLLVRTAETMYQEKSGVVLTVADEGGGISPENIGQIYRPFFSTKGNQGTGLGLWISSEIVRRHHGHMQVRSCASGQRTGTVFRVFLPFQGVAAGDSYRSE